MKEALLGVLWEWYSYRRPLGKKTGGWDSSVTQSLSLNTLLQGSQGALGQMRPRLCPSRALRQLGDPGVSVITQPGFRSPLSYSVMGWGEPAPCDC